MHKTILKVFCEGSLNVHCQRIVSHCVSIPSVVSGLVLILRSPASSELNDGLQLFIEWYLC